MKSRTSFFNRTVFLKDLTRFAPAWGAYMIVLVLSLVSMADSNRIAYYHVQAIETAICVVAVANLIYGAVVAQLLFGDLYNSRMCNALHAMPVNRETWYGSHVAAGLAMSFVPNLLIALLALPVLNLGAGWSAAFWWLLAAECQYIFFFGAAVLCVMLAGNRLGMLALYAIISFAGLGAAWLTSSIYEPLLHGILIDTDVFFPYCPVAEFLANDEPLILNYSEVRNELGSFLYYQLHSVAPGEGWGYLAGTAAVGVLALVGSTALYRKRKLECAGDFVAFSRIAPVVLVLVTVFAGAAFHLFGDVFGMGIKYVLLFTGMAVGFFACRMLLMRTTRVFQKKAFLGCGAIMAAFALTLALTYFDVAGITRYIPDGDEVESITVSNSYSLYRHNESLFTVTEQADFETIFGVHADGINHLTEIPEDSENELSYSALSLRIEYKLKNGKSVNRFYTLDPQSKAGQILKPYFTMPETVLGFPPEQAEEKAKVISNVYVEGTQDYQRDMTDLDTEGLLQAIIADCEAGNMAQFNGYHYPFNYERLGYEHEDFDYLVTHMEIAWETEVVKKAQKEMTQEAAAANGIISRTTYTSLRIYRSCENTLRWLEENNLLTEEMKQETIVKYSG